jgi:hypothetical protein
VLLDGSHLSVPSRNRNSNSLSPLPQLRRLAHVGFDQVGSSIFGAPRNDTSLDTGFGTAVSLSSDGLRLAVGADGHDVTPGSGNGALFVYGFNATTSYWDQSAAFFGVDGEGLGSFFSMSADGSRVAIRRNPGTLTSTVQVYDTVTKTLLGPAISTCAFKSSAVSISPDGNRLAVSCEQFKINPSGLLSNNIGKVDIFQWNGVTLSWEPFGDSLQGSANNVLFGWATSFDTSGSRVAVSAVLHSGGTNRTGAVFVYDHTESASWDQVGDGNILRGYAHLDRFGSTLDLSNDGATLVVGAPTSGPDNIQDGFVSAFELNGGEWVAKGQVLFGVPNSGESFGRSVAVSADGSRFAASSGNANNGTGRVRLFEYKAGSWSQVNEDIEGLSVDDHLGYQQRAIALSGDGKRIVAGSKLADVNGIQTGRARIFDQDLTPSSSPTESPSTSPTSSPTGFPSSTATFATDAPSLSIASATPTEPPTPTETAGPSTAAATDIPAVKPGKFNWDLERSGPVTVVFTQESEDEEIMLTYNISHRTAIIEIFDVECENSVGTEYVNVTQHTTIVSPTHSELSVTLDIKQDKVANSSIWSDGVTSGEGFINLCVRVDLVLDDQTSVNFHEQKLYLSIGLSQGFDASQIDLERQDADKLSKDAQVEFGIISCQCNATFDCVDESTFLVQGDDVFICVSAPADTDIEISAIEELDFIQGSLTIAAVNNSTADELTAVSLYGKIAVVRSQLRSELFDDTSPATLLAQGRVSLRFGNDPNAVRRNLRIGIGSSLRESGTSNSRVLQEQPQEEQAGFAVSMALAAVDQASTDTDNNININNTKYGGMKGALFGGIVGGFAGVALVAALLIARRRKKDDEEEQDEEAEWTF